MKEKLLISACLLGIGCRYDGCRASKIDALTLGEKFDLIPICPEIHLVDECHSWYVVSVSLTPYIFGLRFYTTLCTENANSAV